jgi:hypothetical protein
MNNVRTRANENYRHTKGYIRRGNTISKNKVAICIVLVITSILSIVIGVFVLLYGFFKYSFYDAKPCVMGFNECCEDKNAICDINKSKDKCKNMGKRTANGVTKHTCKYKKGSIPQPDQTKLDKNNKIAHILLYSGAGLLITTIIIYNVF